MEKRVMRSGFFIFVLTFLIFVFAHFTIAEDVVLGKISMVCGMINGHSVDGTIWLTDPDCMNGCNTVSDPVSYCKKFWVGTTKVTPFDASKKGTGIVFVYSGPDNCNTGTKASATAEYNCVSSVALPPPATHKICANQRCIEAVGSGTDECSSNLECAPQQTCNNNVIEGNEVCDGTDLDEKSCTDLGDYTGGTLRCNADCQRYDFSLCTSTATPPVTHKACVSQQCVELPGAATGETCTSNLECTSSSVCGNGWKDDGEQCDDSNLVGGDGCDGQCNLEKPVGLGTIFDQSDKKVTLTWRHYDQLFLDLSSLGGHAVADFITGNAVAEGEEKVGFFQRILNFFRWLFGMKTVGTGMENNGYVIYRSNTGASFVKVGFVDVGSCSNNLCSYEDDVSQLENGDYYYSVSLKLAGVEGLKSNPRIVEIIIESGTTPPPATHKACVNQQCGEVDGAGEDTCSTNAQCIATPPPECTDDGDCSDGERCDASGTCVVVYSDVNNYEPVLNPPLGIGNKNVQAGQRLSFLLNGQDADGNRITYSVKKIRFEDWSQTDVTSGLSLNADTGQVMWDTTAADIGHYIFKFTISDGEFSSSEVVYVTVYAEGTQMCDYAAEGLSAPYGACFEKKPFYCDPINGARYNCSDCGCSNAANIVYLCESSGACVEPYDCQDADGDGTYGVSVGCPEEVAKDCDDTNPNVNPSAVEICGDLIDNDCDNDVDEIGCKGEGGA